MPRDYVIVFEDAYYHRLHPISLSRPTYHVLSGAKTNLERIKHYFSDFEILTLCRPHLSDVFSTPGRKKVEDLFDHQCNRLILINGVDVFRSTDAEFMHELKNVDASVAYIKQGMLVAAVLPQKKWKALFEDVLSLHREGHSQNIMEASNKVEQVDIRTFSYIWDPMLLNPEMIIADFHEFYEDKGSKNNIGKAFIYGKAEISASEDTSADVASVIDAREGPVIIEREATIKPFTYLEGPAFIGGGCRLVGGKITGGCSFGSGCRIGGEVENTLIIANSNKYHEGFIGHSYIGEWANLGALTTNSDLNNSYSKIRVKQNGAVINTGHIKIGCFIGDHSKTGIGTTLNTGIVIGFSCNLYGGAWIMEKEIPSFALGNDGLRREFSLKKAIQTAENVFKRRNFQFKEKHRRLFEHIFNESAMQRKVWSSGNPEGSDM